MIRNCAELIEFEKKMIRMTPPNPAKNFRIVEALYREAVAFGRFSEDPLSGIEIDIELARVINSVP